MMRTLWRWLARGEVAWTGAVTGGLRSLLTVCGVAVGVAAVMTLLAAGQGAKAVVAARFQHLGVDVVTVQANSGAVLRASVAAGLAQRVPDVTAAMPLDALKLPVTWRQSLGTRAEVLGVTTQLPRIDSLPVAAGRFLSRVEDRRALRVAVLGATAANGLFGALNPVGQTIYLGATPFQVVGVLAPLHTGAQLRGSPLASAASGVPGPVGAASGAPAKRARAAKKQTLRSSASLGLGMNNSVLIPERTAELLAGTPAISAIWIKVRTPGAVGPVLSQVRRLLALQAGSVPHGPGHHGGHALVLGHGHHSGPFSVTSLGALVRQAGAASRTLSLLLAAIASISLLVAGIGVLNVMLVAVSERTVEIGLRKAIGATGEDLLAQFLLESVLLCGSGGFLGWLGGYVGIRLFAAVGIAAQPLPGAALLAVAVAVGLGVLCGTYPAFLASELEPVEALRRS